MSLFVWNTDWGCLFVLICAHFGLNLITKFVAYHFDHFDFRRYSELVQECLEIFFHLNGIVVGLCNREYSQLAIFPGAVLFQQERYEHQNSTVVYDPPNIDCARQLYACVREQ